MPPKFLWEPYLRLNNLNIVRGDGGAGKTMLVLAILAAITRGKAPDGMPGILHCEASNVLYLGAEDDLEDYRHRLDLCGCDTRRVFTSRTLPNLGFLEAMERLIRESSAKAVVLDPIQAFLPPGADMNRANEMRPLLDGLRALCRRTACTAILVEHCNKLSKLKVTSPTPPVPCSWWAIIRSSRARAYACKSRATPGTDNRFVFPLTTQGAFGGRVFAM